MKKHGITQYKCSKVNRCGSNLMRIWPFCETEVQFKMDFASDGGGLSRFGVKKQVGAQCPPPLPAILPPHKLIGRFKIGDLHVLPVPEQFAFGTKYRANFFSHGSRG